MSVSENAKTQSTKKELDDKHSVDSYNYQQDKDTDISEDSPKNVNYYEDLQEIT